MPRRPIVNPFRRIKSTEGLTYQALGERLGFSAEFAKKLVSERLTAISATKALRAERLSGGAITFREIMAWVEDREKRRAA